jgi:hypothetical protein
MRLETLTAATLALATLVVLSTTLAAAARPLPAEPAAIICAD